MHQRRGFQWRAGRMGPWLGWGLWVTVLWGWMMEVGGAAPPTPTLLSERTGAGSLRMIWQAPGPWFVLEAAPHLGEDASWTAVSRSVREEEGTWWVDVQPGASARFFRLRLPLATVADSSPRPGETGVSVGRETQWHFTRSLGSQAMLGASQVSAMAGGRKLLTRVELSQDRRRVSLFYLEPLPGNARVTAVLDTEGLEDEWGLAVDGDGDGEPGGLARFWFDTLNLTAVTGTAVVGQVLAAEQEMGPGGVMTNRPLAGVTVTVDGREQDMRAVTDNEGRFRLEPVPAGRFFVHIDGRTSAESEYPGGYYYPTVGKSWDAVAGVRTNWAGGTGVIYLPRIEGASLVTASATQSTEVGFASSVVGTNAVLGLARVTVPANALFGDDGTRGGRVGMAPVPPDRLPGPLPEGLELPTVFTVQTDGAGNFDVPAGVCLPNDPAVVTGAPLPPGTRRDLISFDHKKGVWESVGPMRVTEDGLRVCTEPGVGIRQPGWHGAGVPAFRGPSSGGGLGGGTSGGGSGGWPGNRPLGSGAGAGAGSGGGVLGGSASGGQNPGSPGGGAGSPSPGGGSGAGTGAGGGGTGGGGGGGGETGGSGGCPEGGLDPCLARANAEKARCDESKHASLDEYGKQCSQTRDRLGAQHPESKACWETYSRLYYQATLNCNQLKTDYVADCAGCVGGDGGGAFRHQTVAAAEGMVGSVLGLLDQAGEFLVNRVTHGEDVDEAVQAQVVAWMEQAATLAGGDAAAFLREQVRWTEEDGAGRYSSFGEDRGNAPPYPVALRAFLWRPDGLMTVRGETEAYGGYTLFIPQDGRLLHVEFYDPRTRKYGWVTPNQSPTAALAAPRLRLFPLPEDAMDQDGDGLSDFAEGVLGTQARVADTDGDGVPDGTEVEQGSNPLDGLAVRTGVIAAVDTPGRAVDVVADDDLAVVADGQAGLAVFDLANPLRPVLAAQVDTPGDARAVAMSARHVAVADGAAGLAIVDLTADLPLGVRQQLDLGSAVVAVAASRGVAYVALENREVVVVDLFTGMQFGRRRIGGSGAMQDVAVTEWGVYVLTATELVVLDLGDSELPELSRVAAPGQMPGSFRRKRLSVVNDRLYASHRQGFTVFDLSDPRMPEPRAHHVTGQFGWKQLVPVQPGWALAPGGADSVEGSGHHLHLYDLGPEGTNAVFQTTLPTPDAAVAVAVWKGLALVADDRAGLQVVAFRAVDLDGAMPTVTVDDATLGISEAVVEGQPFRVAARAIAADVVRSVEFFLDDELMATAGRYPYEREILAPLRSAGRTAVTLRARVTDGSGRMAWSAPRELRLEEDVTAPEVAYTVPGAGRVFAPLTGLVMGAAFTEHLEGSTVTIDSFRLASAGRNGVMGDADDVWIEVGAAGYRGDVQTAWRSVPQALPAGRYRGLLTGSIADAAGNPMSSPVDWEFQVVHGDLRAGGSLLVSGAIDRFGVEDTFTWEGRAGQLVYFDEVTGTCNSGLRWRCVGPDGGVLFDETLGGLGCGSDVGIMAPPMDGIYRVEIRGEPGRTNSWSVGIHDVPAPISVVVRVGDTVSEDLPVAGAGRIETPGSRDHYVLEGQPGREVFFEEPVGDCGSRIRWSLTDPNGAVVFDEVLGGQGCGRHVGRVLMTESGEYRISVSGVGDATGGYTFRTWDIVPQEFAVGGAVEIGADHPGPGAGRLETPGAVDLYTFEVEPGTAYVFEAFGAGSALTTIPWTLTDEDGVEMFSACLGCTDPGRIILSRGGTYTVRVGSAKDSGTGTYQLRWGP